MSTTVPILCGFVLTALALLATGCSQPATPSPVAEGCSPQVDRAVLAEETGTIAVTVTDRQGQPQPGVTVRAIREVYTGTRCLSMVEATTGPDGRAVFERMRTGQYLVRLAEGAAEIRATLEAGATWPVQLIHTP